MLGWRQVTPRWENDPVYQSEILGQIHGKYRWVDEPVWWLWRRLLKLEGLGSIHNNNRQILGFEQSLTEVWKKPHHNLVTLFAPGDWLTHTTHIINYFTVAP